DCVAEAMNLVSPRASAKGLRVASRIDASVPRAIVGDATRLRQVLLNLLSNGVKFTHTGEVIVGLTATPAAGADGGRKPRPNDAGEIEIRGAVRDTGIGIAADRMDRLFRSFSQIDASTTRQFGGTGLGLAISKRLVELMGGRLWVKSEVGL